MIHLAIGAFVIQSSVQADIEHNLTFALTASYSDPTLRERDEDGEVIQGGDLVFSNGWETSRPPVTTSNFEEGSKITVERFSNREILTELIVEGGHDTSIRGWALKLITPSDYEEEYFARVSMFAVKGDQVVSINAALDRSAFAVQYKYAYTSSYNNNTDKITERESGSAKFLEEVFIEMQIGDFLLDFTTMHSGSETLRLFGTGDDRFSVWIPSTLAFTSIVGSAEAEFDDDEDEPAVLQGDMRASGAKLLLP